METPPPGGTRPPAAPHVTPLHDDSDSRETERRKGKKKRRGHASTQKWAGAERAEFGGVDSPVLRMDCAGAGGMERASNWRMDEKKRPKERVHVKVRLL